MKQFIKDSFKKAMPLFLGLGMAIVLFFIIFRYNGLHSGFNRIIVILKPFIYGGVMAYLLKTPYNWIEKKLIGLLSEKRAGLVRILSVIIVMVLSLAVIYVLLSMVIPALARSVISIAREIPPALTRFEVMISEYTTNNQVLDNYIDEAINSFKTNGVDWLRSNILPSLQGMMGGFVSKFGSLFGVLYNLLIGIIICVYLLLGKTKLGRQARMVVYSVFKRETADKILDEFTFIDKTFVGFFGGKILDSAVVGLICYIFALIMQFAFGLKNAVLISVIVGVTNIIPFFGPYIGEVITALIILIDSPVNCVIFLIFLILLQQFDGNFLGPMLLSESVGLSGFWVLFSITIFGGIFGIVGILVGVPIFAVIYDLMRRWVYRRLKKHEITEYLPVQKEGSNKNTK